MGGVSIIIPVFNRIETTMQCIGFIERCNRNSRHEIIVVDNGSTDETPEVFQSRLSASVSYIRNPENLGVSEALNVGAGAARCDVLCFMHNDVFVSGNEWTALIHEFAINSPHAGVIGLYGTRTIRKDGTFRGKTIVHARKDASRISGNSERVAVVDGLLMAMTKAVFEKIGGFNSQFSVHYYDKDISMRAVRAGLKNHVLNIPFEHRCGTTRAQVPEEDAMRDTAQSMFEALWREYLPVDVSTWKEKVRYLFQRAEN